MKHNHFKLFASLITLLIVSLGIDAQGIMQIGERYDASGLVCCQRG